MTDAIKIEVNEKELFKSVLKADLQDSIAECTKALEEIQYQRQKIVIALWPGFDWLEHELDFVWECKASPAHWCVYHRWDDRAHDHCLFCEQPSERK